ncbi:MAG: creatininase family protein [Polyangia bacterium]
MKWLAELSWTEAAAERARGPIVLLPIGSTEAHGPHLPLATDAILSEELAKRAAAALEASGRAALIAPTLGYAITEYAAAFAGTVSLSTETATQLVTEVCASLIAQGFERVCLVNSHLEPAHVASLKEACGRVERRTGRAVAFPDQTARRWARTLTEEYKRGACHAGSYETSLMLAARPELVNDAARRRLAPLPIDLAQAMKAGIRTFGQAGAPDAYFGDPAAATVEEGNAIYSLLVTMVLDTARERWPAGAVSAR